MQGNALTARESNKLQIKQDVEDTSIFVESEVLDVSPTLGTKKSSLRLDQLDKRSKPFPNKEKILSGQATPREYEDRVHKFHTEKVQDYSSFDSTTSILDSNTSDPTSQRRQKINNVKVENMVKGSLTVKKRESSTTSAPHLTQEAFCQLSEEKGPAEFLKADLNFKQLPSFCDR